MKIFIIILIILLVLIAAITFGVTTYTFYHPAKSRMVPKVVSDFDCNYYGEHLDEVKMAMDEMDETETEKVSVISFDGYKLIGHLFIRDISKPYILFAHGYHGSYMRDGYGSFLFSKHSDLNILMIEQRSHGNSESNFITFGVKESKDIVTWIDFLNLRFDSPRIVLSGVSMGAATVMMALNHNLPDNVEGVIEDCGYTSPKEIIINTANGMKIPGKLFYPLARLGEYIASGADMNSVKAVDGIESTKLPVLFIHSKADGFVPFEMSDRLYDICNSDKSRLIVENVSHAVTALYCYDEYEKTVFEFLRKIKIL